jgi:hypothetical protein
LGERWGRGQDKHGGCDGRYHRADSSGVHVVLL